MADGVKSSVHEVPGVDPEEARLVEGLVRRDPVVVGEFLERTHRGVYALACRLTTDPDLRQDWTHDALLAIVDELGRGRFEYRWPGCFWSWFSKRSRFLLLDACRRRSRDAKRQVDIDEAEDIVAQLRAAGVEDPDQLLADVELRAAIEKCVGKIPSEDQRRALTLAVFEEASYEDVAVAMQAPLNTVRSWIRRARITARRCVSQALGLEEAA